MAYRRVRRPSDKDELLRRLIDNNPFETYREALIFAAALGVANDRRVAFEKTEEPIPWEVFSNVPGVAVIDMIAAATSDELDVLGDDDDAFDRRLTMFEEYANGGLEVLRQILETDSRTPQDVILDLVLNAEGEGPGDSGLNLAAIADELAT